MVAGERAFGVQSPCEVLQHRPERGAAGGGFCGLDEELERGGFGVGLRGIDGGCHALKQTLLIANCQGLQEKSYICRNQSKCSKSGICRDLHKRRGPESHSSSRFVVRKPSVRRCIHTA